PEILLRLLGPLCRPLPRLDTARQDDTEVLVLVHPEGTQRGLVLVDERQPEVFHQAVDRGGRTAELRGRRFRLGESPPHDRDREHHEDYRPQPVSHVYSPCLSIAGPGGTNPPAPASSLLASWSPQLIHCRD